MLGSDQAADKCVAGIMMDNSTKKSAQRPTDQN